VYVSDRHPQRDQLLARRTGGPRPPEPDGQVLATFPRRSREGPDAELRVILQEYQGHEFIGVSLWERGTGGFWPARGKTLSIRRGEARQFAEAVLAGLRLMEGPDDCPLPVRRDARGRREPGQTRRPTGTASVARAYGQGGEFDECGDAEGPPS
jgi:hypothetical protein